MLRVLYYDIGVVGGYTLGGVKQQSIQVELLLGENTFYHYIYAGQCILFTSKIAYVKHQP